MKAKKSMFITTILMVAVLVVAVSTATFAWYTASSQVDAKNAVITSASSSAANIAIGWEDNATDTSITFNTTATLAPMAPKAELVKYVDEENKGTAFADLKLYSSPIDLNGDFTVTPTDASTAWVSNGEGATDNKFYIINRNVNQGASVKMTMQTVGAVDNNNKLVVAVFVDGYLQGVFATGGKFVYGEITSGKGYDEMTTVTDATGNADIIVSEIIIELGSAESETVGTAKAIQVVAWLDGELLTQSFADKTAEFKFDFAPVTGA